MTRRALRAEITRLRRAPRRVLIARYESLFGQRPPTKRRGYLRLALLRELETELGRRRSAAQLDDELTE